MRRLARHLGAVLIMRWTGRSIFSMDLGAKVLIASVGDAVSVIFWSLVLFALVIGACMAVMWYRKRVMSDEEPGGDEGFSISDLKRLRQQGKMTDGEFEKAMAQMKAAAKATTSALPEVMSPERKAAARRAREEQQARRNASNNSSQE